VTQVLPPTDVSPANVNVFASQVAVHGPHVFSIDVERPAAGTRENGFNLRTVVRHGIEQKPGRWTWTATIVDDATVDDPYHTQGSIAVDRRGFVHIAYGMHNMPWQYAVSKMPLDTREFDFRGEPVTLDARRTLKLENRTDFPRSGTADIPGTQVTYPRFVVDRTGDLYVTYRFALRPKRGWSDRDLAGGVARYDVTTRKWTALGGAIDISRDDAELPHDLRELEQIAFAYEPKWTPYHLRPWFDRRNHMQLAWTWREGGPGPRTTHPSFAKVDPASGAVTRSDSSKYRMPIGLQDVELIGDSSPSAEYVAGISITTDEHDRVYTILQPANGLRQIWMRAPDQTGWRSAGPSPFGATELIADEVGNLWAFASGPRILRRPTDRRDEWQLAYSADGWCYPKPVIDVASRRIFVHLQSCDLKQVEVLALPY
jgi:hypothetical protein